MQVQSNSFDRLWADCGPAVHGAVERVGASGWYILGKEVAGFEAALADWTSTPHAIGVANGMDAMEIALRILNIGRGDKVLTTALSAFPTALSILRAGAVPVFADTDAHGLLDPEAAAAAFAEHPDIKAIVPVHLYGHLADMRALQDLADRHGAHVIEDAAQAIGARREDYGVGAAGRLASLSFYPTKNLGVIGDGGALLVQTAEQADAARSVRNYGQTERYIHGRAGLNSRLDELHAACLTDAFLPRLSGWMERRRAVARTYLDGIDNPAVGLMPGPDTEQGGWHLFPVLVAPESRDGFMRHLKQAGIDSGIHYPVLMPEQRATAEYGEPLVSGPLANARRIANSEVSLPIHPYLTEAELDRVIAAVNAWSA